MLYRIGNVIIKRNTAITKDEITSEWKRTTAEEFDDFKDQFVGLEKASAKDNTDLDMPDIHKLNEKEIPIRYTFLNPVILEVIGEEMAAFTGHPTMR